MVKIRYVGQHNKQINNCRLGGSMSYSPLGKRTSAKNPVLNLGGARSYIPEKGIKLKENSMINPTLNGKRVVLFDSINRGYRISDEEEFMKRGGGFANIQPKRLTLLDTIKKPVNSRLTLLDVMKGSTKKTPQIKRKTLL